MSMETVTLLMAEVGLWRMPSSQGRAGYQVHFGGDDDDVGEDEDDDDRGVGANGRHIQSSSSLPSSQATFTLMMGKTGPLAHTGESI